MVRCLCLIIVLATASTARTIPGRFIVEMDDQATTRMRVRDRLNARKLKIRGGVQRVANAFFVEAADAEELRRMPGVRRVTPVIEYELFLDRSALLHRVNEIWNRTGLERAGDGIKIGIIDSGVDVNHPCLRDDSLPPLEGYPRAGSVSDRELHTNTKVIVARSYVESLRFPDPDTSAADRSGHGTAVASAAAGVAAQGRLATIQGMAPRARIGSYKVFGSPTVNDYTNNEAILRAIEDAVNDGMDVLNLSLGSRFASRLEADPVALALERATRNGVIVVVAAGNEGNDPSSLGSPASTPSVITVGATTNGRVFASGVELPGRSPFFALAGASFGQNAAVSAPLADVLPLDGNGLACGPLPAGSLQARVAIILRGTCTFETKLTNAQAAGAGAAVVFAAQDAPEPVRIGTGAATLPAVMVSHPDGLALRAQAPSTVTVRFQMEPLASEPFRLARFSAAGPAVDLGIKPEILATGTDVYVAAQRLDDRGSLYDPDGFRVVDGTSFSAPIVAGIAALLKQARPGLTVDQYRSLLINAARPLTGTVQQFGAGVLDAAASAQSTLVAAPATVSFGTGTAPRTFNLGTLDTAAETCNIEVIPARAGPAPIAPPSVRLEPGASEPISLEWNSSTLPPGVYEGFVVITGSRTGQVIRIPYWAASSTNQPATVQLMDQEATGRPGTMVRDAFEFRLLEATGIVLRGITPEVTVVSGGGSVRRLTNVDGDIPGLFQVDVSLGNLPGPNVFRVQSGNATRTITITGR